MISRDRLISLLERLTGETPPIPTAEIDGAYMLLAEAEGEGERKGLGWSQFNELLLLLGYDRVSRGFFQFLIDGTIAYEPGRAFKSIDDLEKGVCRFQELALFVFGNFKFAFKKLSSDAKLLDDWIYTLEPRDAQEFTERHDPLVSLRQIPPQNTYLLGYYIEKEINDRLAIDPNDQEAIELAQRRRGALADALYNHITYLSSDHLDVYVATSMRRRHEYLVVSRLTRQIFDHANLGDLKLRFFDPTQAWCPQREDKGLSEALMLRRAKCTIYLAQESETLGKDSELASTLAQGKPVIAYVPVGDQSYVDELLAELETINPYHTEAERILELLEVYDPGMAWKDPSIRRALENPAVAPIGELRATLYDLVFRFYKKKADNLKCTHPLGIQVYLQTGVANGVLVVRTVDDCVELVRRIMLRQMKFTVTTDEKDGKVYTELREDVSGCVFRVVTGDEMLTNAFWNFYLTNDES